MQNTLKNSARFTGIGLHTGQAVRMVVKPAAAHYGIWFKRTDIDGISAYILAKWDLVVPSRLCTMVENQHGVRVSTIEHIMAALSGCGIHNALIEINGPEVPILDGSALPFMRGFIASGVQRQSASLHAIRIEKTVEVRDGAAIARLESADGFEMRFEIDFDDDAIGRQEKYLKFTRDTFAHELSDSRTFCSESDVAKMRGAGLALGGSMENAVVFSGSRVLSPGGLRHADEPVRHKMLDAIGDLYLAGHPIIGRYTGIRAGHALTNKLLRALFSQTDAWSMTECAAPRHSTAPQIKTHPSDLAPQKYGT